MNDAVFSGDAALHKLAERLGLYREYVSASGEQKQISDESLRALARALGYGAESDDEAQRSLDALEQTNSGLLDPVIVVKEGGSLEAQCRGTAGVESIEWTITYEDGHTDRGRAGLQPASGEGARAAQHVLRLPLDGVAIGYHKLDVKCGDRAEMTTVIVVPARAYTPEAWKSGQRRDWAITAQLYSLRSKRNWGIGDFSDLAALAKTAAKLGASALGLNPLHALFPANPAQVSPYSPSSRAFLNPIYIDVEAVPELRLCEAAQAMIAEPEFQEDLRAARESELIDYVAVWKLKRRALQALHVALAEKAHKRPTQRSRAFREFKRAGGNALQRFAVFEALQQHFLDQGGGLSWRDWPEPYQSADSPEVAAWARAHAAEIEFSQYLQWEADRQLGAAVTAMRKAGMQIGLYRDVAVAVDPNGAEAWADHALLVAEASVGAPPDSYNTKGQNWGLTPFNPLALKSRAYEPFISAIRANMRHAGAIRIDHVIGLKRLYWVPRGMDADAGGYIAYPYEDLMGIIALESWRHRCLVVGEDLGTVPEGFREDAERRGILSYRVLMFERENGDGAFLSPAQYPELAAAAVSTHDLPTLAGFWTGRDLEWREKLNLYASPEAAAGEAVSRQRTRQALIEALTAHGGLKPEEAGVLSADDAASTSRLAEAAHRFLARAPSSFLLVQLEDIVGEIEQMNLPGTVDEHPNWRRKLRVSVERILRDARAVRVASAIRAERGAGM